MRKRLAVAWLIGVPAGWLVASVYFFKLSEPTGESCVFCAGRDAGIAAVFGALLGISGVVGLLLIYTCFECAAAAGAKQERNERDTLAGVAIATGIIGSTVATLWLFFVLFFFAGR